MLLPLVQMSTCRHVAVYGELVLDIPGERAIVGGYEIILQQSDWAILSRLAAAGGAFVRGADLLEEIWGDDMRDDPMFLRSWVRRLNNRLGSCCSGRPLIDTLPGSYRLISPAEWSRESQRVLG
jgi:DNA-binding response OmpR family regulator